MGLQRRMSPGGSRPLLAVLACAALWGGCGKANTTEERRRVLLTPTVSKKQLEEQRRERELFDGNGNVLPSKEKVAGLLLPKGLKQYRSSEHEWAYESDRVSPEAYVRYFSQRLAPTTVERVPGVVIYGSALIKDEPLVPRVKVQVEQLKGSLTASRVMIKQLVARRPTLSPAEAEAKLQQLRTRAE